MKKLPKIEKKHLIAGAALTAVALVAFALGSKNSAHPEAHAEVKADAHGEKVAVAKPAHEPDEGKGVAHTPDRAPASSPRKEAPSEEAEPYLEEEEVDTQIAHHLPHGKAITKSDTVVKTESAVAPKEDHRGTFKRLVDTYADAWESIQTKVHSIQQAEEENKRLKLENAYLRVMVESGKFNIRSEEAKKKTETVGKKLATAAGSKAARSIASIRYQFPENLHSEALLALGVSYFKARDDEKAAVILNFLTNLEDEPVFRTASNYLMAGVSFYRLESYKNAAEYFDRISKLPATDEASLKAKRQAVYWKALVAERMKNRGLAQKLILESLEKDPHAKEARWVNPQGVPSKTRMPASTSAAEHKAEESHEGHSSQHH